MLTRYICLSCMVGCAKDKIFRFVQTILAHGCLAGRNVHLQKPVFFRYHYQVSTYSNEHVRMISSFFLLPPQELPLLTTSSIFYLSSTPAHTSKLNPPEKNKVHHRSLSQTCRPHRQTQTSSISNNPPLFTIYAPISSHEPMQKS